MTLTKNAIENNEGKGKNAASQHFFLFPQYLLLYQREKSSLQQCLNLSSANAFEFGNVQIYVIWYSETHSCWTALLAQIQIFFSGEGGPSENALVLLYDTLICGFAGFS